MTVEVEQGRHPALPKESWEVVNAAHFKAYKAQIARHWPPSPSLECPYPSPPDIEDEEDWRAYIEGDDEGDEEDEDEDMDEEEAMNAPPKPARPREGREPLVSLLAGLDTVSTNALPGQWPCKRPSWQVGLLKLTSGRHARPPGTLQHLARGDGHLVTVVGAVDLRPALRPRQPPRL